MMLNSKKHEHYVRGKNDRQTQPRATTLLLTNNALRYML